MSIKRAIIDRIPQEWDYVLRKNKVLTKFVNNFYEDLVPNFCKNRYQHKIAITSIATRIKLGFGHCVPTLIYKRMGLLHKYTTKEAKFWEEIEQEIIIYKEQCR